MNLEEEFPEVEEHVRDFVFVKQLMKQLEDFKDEIFVLIQRNQQVIFSKSQNKAFVSQMELL